VVLTFGDGTFATLGIIRGNDVGDEEIEDDSLNLFDFGDDELIKVGIATSEELAYLRAAEYAESLAAAQAEQDIRDRKEFLRLKMKFGS
jgi:hypothetical protein